MKKTYLYLENYAYLNVVENSAIIKNTISDDYILFEDKTSVLLLSNLQKNITGSIEIETERHNTLINKIRNTFTGDILSSLTQPIQVNNTLDITNRIKITPNKETPLLLNEVTFFLNNNCNHNNNCHNVSRQYNNHCNGSVGIHHELSLSNIKKWLDTYNDKLIESIILTGGDPLSYPCLIELLSYLYSKNIPTTLTIHENEINSLLSFDNKFSLTKYCKIEIIFNKSLLNGEIQKLINYYQLINFTFLIEDEQSYIESLDFIENNKIENFKHIPVYNNNNLRFFEDNIFTKTKNILSQEIPIEQIIFNSKYNLNFINRLTVNSNGDIFSNFNFEVIGNILKNNIQSLIIEELERDGAWRKVRRNIFPCKNCNLHDLCPSITNYEYSLGKFDTCDKN